MMLYGGVTVRHSDGFTANGSSLDLYEGLGGITPSPLWWAFSDQLLKTPKVRRSTQHEGEVTEISGSSSSLQSNRKSCCIVSDDGEGRVDEDGAGSDPVLGRSDHQGRA